MHRAFAHDWLVAAAMLGMLAGCTHQQSPASGSPIELVPGRHADARRFPMSPDSLEGRRVLLIVVPLNDVQTVYFLTGTAEWSGTELRVHLPSGGEPVIARGSRVALEGFDPAVLPRLIVPEQYPQIATLARGVDAAVAVFAPTAPTAPDAAVSLKLKTPFYGLARGAAGEVLLMQGGPD